MRKPWPTRSCCAMQKKNKKIVYLVGTQPSLYNLTAKIRRMKKGNLDLNTEKI
jgi:hypothetical protein